MRPIYFTVLEVEEHGWLFLGPGEGLLPTSQHGKWHLGGSVCNWENADGKTRSKMVAGPDLFFLQNLARSGTNRGPSRTRSIPSRRES